MAFDLKIEIFAYNCFNNVWKNYGVNKTGIDIRQVYRDECIKDNSYTEACAEVFYAAISCRYFLFINIYWEEIDFEYAIKWKSLSDCFDYFTLTCERKDLFGHLTVFEKLFATVTFAVILFSRVNGNSSIDVINYSYIIWAMYFDKFTEKFYKEGGWKELKRVANTYHVLYDFLRLTEEKNLNKYKEASINYLRFKNALKYECNKMHKGKVPISLIWIKFQTEQFKNRVTISNYEDFMDIVDTEFLLNDLRLVFNFSSESESDANIIDDKSQREFYSTGMSYSETFDDCEEIKNYPRNQNLRTGEPFCYEVRNRDNFENQHQAEILSTNSRADYPEIAGAAKNFIHVKDSCEMGVSEMKSDSNLCEYSRNECDNLQDRPKSPRYKTDNENVAKIADLNLNCLADITLDNSEKGLDDISSPRNIKRQNELMNTDVLSTSQKKEFERTKQIASKYSPNSRDIYSKNEFVKSRVERESSTCSLVSDFYSEGKETHNKISELANTLIVNEMGETQNEENEILKNPSSPKAFMALSEVANKSDGRLNNDNDQNKLREEQADPEIGSFLRMILVLGDRQGIQHVLRHFETSKTQKTQAKSKNTKE